MDTLQILGFTFVALLLVISPGPNGLLIAKTVPIQGEKAGFANVLGCLTAFYLHGALSILGISVLITKSAEAFMILKILGAFYLAWLGIKSLISAFSESPPPVQTQRKNTKKVLNKAFLEGFTTNALNPKVSMFYLAAFPQFIPTGDSALLYALLLVTIHSIMNLVWFSSMVILFSRLTALTKKGVFQRILRGVTGVVFIGFGAKLITLEEK